MSSSLMQIEPGDVDTIEKRGKYVISIVDCSQAGLVHACLFAEAGFRVKCADKDLAVVSDISRGKTSAIGGRVGAKLRSHVKEKRVEALNNVSEAVSKSDLIVLATAAEVDDRRRIDYSEISSELRRVGPSLRRDCLFLVVGVVGIGITEGLVQETLENTSGLKAELDFGLAYSPNRILNDQTLEAMKNNTRILGAIGKRSLNAASVILETISRNGLNKTNSIRTAEAAVLFEVLHQNVSNTLAGELAILCEKLKLDCVEVNNLVDKPVCRSLFAQPLDWEDVQERTFLLLGDVEDFDAKLRIPAVTREVNEASIKHIISLIRDALRACGKTLRRARISLIGISREPNIKSHPKRTVREIVKMLEHKGAKVSLYDPYVLKHELGEMQRFLKRNLTEATEGVDCVIVMTKHNQLMRMNLKKMKVITRKPAAIVDLVGILDPEKVEKQGLIYRGFGRGLWKR